MTDYSAILERLQLYQARLMGLLPNVERPWRSPMNESAHLMLHGARGVGKTNYLLRQAKNAQGLYFSADHPLLAVAPLFETVEALFERGVTRVFIDEVHQAREWGPSLKTLYDNYPDRGIWISGSSSLLLEQGVADLSRRFPLSSMPFLSFREYLLLCGQPDAGVHAPLARDDAWAPAFLKRSPVLRHFEDYLSQGTRPIFLEGVAAYPTKVLQTVQKTLESDIPHLVGTLSTSHLHLMTAMLGHLARAPIPTLSVNSLCRDWRVGKEKLYQLLQALERSGVIHVVRKASDHAAASIGAKIFLADPTLYSALGGSEGNVREAYVVMVLRALGYSVWAAPDEQSADLVVDDLTIEVGGRNKQRKKADLVIRDGAEYPSPGVLPLWMLGMGW